MGYRVYKKKNDTYTLVRTFRTKEDCDRFINIERQYILSNEEFVIKKYTQEYATKQRTIVFVENYKGFTIYFCPKDKKYIVADEDDYEKKEHAKKIISEAMGSLSDGL